MAKKKKKSKKKAKAKKSSKRKSKSNNPLQVVWTNGAVHIEDREFRPREGARLTKAEAEKYGTHIYHLADQGYDCAPESLLKDARKPSSPLHSYLDWNNASAANKWRVEQMQYLCRSIIVVDSDPSGQFIESPMMISIQTGSKQTERTYMPTHTVMLDPNLRQQALLTAANDLRNMALRYQHLQALSKLCRGIMVKCDSILASVNKDRKHKKRKKKIKLPRKPK